MLSFDDRNDASLQKSLCECVPQQHGHVRMDKQNSKCNLGIATIYNAKHFLTRFATNTKSSNDHVIWSLVVHYVTSYTELLKIREVLFWLLYGQEGYDCMACYRMACS